MHRRWLVAALSAVVIAAGVGGWLLTGAGSGASAPGHGFSYVVEYRVVERGVPQWEVLAAQRPFSGSDLTYPGSTRPGADATAHQGTVSTATDLYVVSDTGVHLASGRQPGPPSNDTWLSVELPDLLTRGLARDLHTTERVAGRSCHEYRFHNPPSGPIQPLRGPGYDDLCITPSGLLLSERWHYRGSLVLARTAVVVQTDAGWPRSVPRPPSTTDAGAGPPAAAIVRPDPRPSSFLATPPAPAGFHRYGTFSFQLPDPQDSSRIVASSVVWAFTAGSHVITVEAGAEQGGGLPWRPGDTVTRPVGLPGFPAATTALRSDGPEVRIPVSGGRWVRLRGTVPLRTLTAYAKGLRLSASG